MQESKINQLIELIKQILTEQNEENEELRQEIQDLKATQEAWVKGPRAYQITGISYSVLRRGRDTPGTLLRYNAKDKTYEVKSLLAFKRAREKKKADPLKLRRKLRGE